MAVLDLNKLRLYRLFHLAAKRERPFPIIDAFSKFMPYCLYWLPKRWLDLNQRKNAITGWFISTNPRKALSRNRCLIKFGPYCLYRTKSWLDLKQRKKSRTSKKRFRVDDKTSATSSRVSRVPHSFVHILKPSCQSRFESAFFRATGFRYIVLSLQCDHIWRNFPTLVKFDKFWQFFAGSFSIWQNC